MRLAPALRSDRGGVPRWALRRQSAPSLGFWRSGNLMRLELVTLEADPRMSSSMESKPPINHAYGTNGIITGSPCHRAAGAGSNLGVELQPLERASKRPGMCLATPAAPAALLLEEV